MRFPIPMLQWNSIIITATATTLLPAPITTANATPHTGSNVLSSIAVLQCPAWRIIHHHHDATTITTTHLSITVATLSLLLLQHYVLTIVPPTNHNHYYHPMITPPMPHDQVAPPPTYHFCGHDVNTLWTRIKRACPWIYGLFGSKKWDWIPDFHFTNINFMEIYIYILSFDT